MRRGCALLVLERLIHVVTEPLFLRPITASLLAGTAASGSPRHHAPFREPVMRQASVLPCGLATHSSHFKPNCYRLSGAGELPTMTCCPIACARS